MSRWSKISWLICALSLVILLATRFILGGWVTYLYGPLILCAASFMVALLLDIKIYIEFLTMKTTKQGMNMGVMIVLALVLLVSVNYLGVRHNKTWDLTSEKLHSLSEQSQNILKSLTDDLQVTIFYRGDKDRQAKQQLKQVFSLYQESSSKLNLRFVDSYVEAGLATEYLKQSKDVDKVVVFVEYNKKRIRVSEPYGEEKITEALIKSTRENKKIYFITGHGERDIDSDDLEGLEVLKQSLESSSFKVEKLSLLEGSEIPQDADVLAIVGSKTAFFEAELAKIKSYAQVGGKLLIALDPGQKHNLTELIQSFGVEFNNDFIINDRIRIQGGGMATALGLIFPAGSEITKGFVSGNDATVFHIASSLKKSSSADESLTFKELVQTPPSSYLVNEITSQSLKKKNHKRSTFTIGVSVSGPLPLKQGEKVKDSTATKPKEFAAVIFGDSDFLAKKYLFSATNRDLAMNSIAFLADESDLVSIRPKQPKGTKLTLTSTTQGAVVVAGVALPLILLILSGVFWFRRRGA